MRRTNWHWGLLLAAFVLAAPAAATENWQFDWSVRTDRHDRPAGHYELTPYPITETTTSYTIVNDEGAKACELGARFYVDGARPDDDGDGRSLAAAKRTIAATVQAAGPGNVTIIVRGAHDDFDGVYYETIRTLTGADDAHRWTLTGYGQERPTLDGRDGTEPIIAGTGAPKAFLTLQRLKLQNCKRSGIKMVRDGHVNLVDVWVGDCAREPGADDAGICLANCRNGLILHCTSERTKGHGFALGDGTSDTIIEWSVAGECGSSSCPAAIDLSGGRRAGDARALTCRYSIAKDSPRSGLRIRAVQDFTVHHSEVFNTARRQVVIAERATCGAFHSNVVRDPAGTRSRGLVVDGITGDSRVVTIHNNLIYGMHQIAILVGANNDGLALRIYNNSIYTKPHEAAQVACNGIESRLGLRSDLAVDLEVKNNIIAIGGLGECIRGAARHSHNLFHYPGSLQGGPVRYVAVRGTELGVGDSDGQPGWDSMP